MNRINRKHMIAVTNYLLCLHFNPQGIFTESEEQRAIREEYFWREAKEARIWCAIKESIRKGYKVRE